MAGKGAKKVPKGGPALMILIGGGLPKSPKGRKPPKGMPPLKGKPKGG